MSENRITPTIKFYGLRLPPVLFPRSHSIKWQRQISLTRSNGKDKFLLPFLLQWKSSQLASSPVLNYVQVRECELEHNPALQLDAWGENFWDVLEHQARIKCSQLSFHSEGSSLSLVSLYNLILYQAPRQWLYLIIRFSIIRSRIWSLLIHYALPKECNCNKAENWLHMILHLFFTKFIDGETSCLFEGIASLSYCSLTGLIIALSQYFNQNMTHIITIICSDFIQLSSSVVLWPRMLSLYPT